MTQPSRGMSGEQRRALDMLAGSPDGCTEGALRAHGFTVRLLAAIVRAGLAVARPEIVKAGGRTQHVALDNHRHRAAGAR
jgi:hypothetical protein